jgi:hypothetical protein
VPVHELTVEINETRLDRWTGRRSRNHSARIIELRSRRQRERRRKAALPLRDDLVAAYFEGRHARGTAHGLAVVLVQPRGSLSGKDAKLAACKRDDAAGSDE